MHWLLGALAIAALGTIYVATSWVHAGIVAYHAVCLAGILIHRRRVRALLAGGRSTALWSIGTTLAILAGLAVPLLVWDPSSVREEANRQLFAWPDKMRTFAFFAAYTMIVHAPLEEIFWRGCFTDVEKASMRTAVLGNAAGFYLVHAVALAYGLGKLGLLVALPTAAAGAVWAFVTHRTRSLWPALWSHWAADAAILGGMWFFFLRS